LKHIFTLLLITISFFQISCLKKKDKELRIYNWSYYIPENIIEDFEKEYNVKVNYDTFDSNEEMYENIRKNLKKPDIVFPSGDVIKLMQEKDLLHRLDKSKIPNFGNIDETILNKVGFDPGNKYSVPYMVGAAGIAVNTKYVSDYPKDYSIYELEKYQGKMMMLNDMREVIGAALSDLGYSVNSTNQTELEQAKQLAIIWKKNISDYDAENFAMAFANEEVWIVQCYIENIMLEIDEDQKKNIDFFIPKKGGTMYIDNMVILKDAKNKDMAHKFINYIHRPKVYANISDWLSLPSLNKTAREYTNENKIYTQTEMQNCEFIESIDNAMEEYRRIWKEIISK